MFRFRCRSNAPFAPRRRTTQLGWLLLPVVLTILFGASVGCQPTPGKGQRKSAAAPPAPRTDASQKFFDQGTIPHLKFQVSEAQVEKLRTEPRSYARTHLWEDENRAYKNVAVKLKGAAGSFRELDDKPAFTVHMGKFRSGQRFHDLEKFHLNNSVQDESYLCELICSRICAEAKIPAPRVTHARVWFNERDLGLYVLKESFDRHFVARHFSHANGNLYDGGFLLEIDNELERDAGDGVDDRSDLLALAEACREPDPAERWRRMAELLDVDRFVSFMALELMTCHWDGYCCNRNNYRVYFDPQTKQANFFPHGMDQMFGDPGFPLFQNPEPLVAAAVLQNPDWRTKLRTRIVEFQPLFAPEKLHPLIDEVAARLQPALAELGPEAVAAHTQQVAELKERIAARATAIAEQLTQPEPLPLEFGDGQPHLVTDWYPVQEVEDAKHEMNEVNGQAEWSIEAGPSGVCIASWRSRVFLHQGHYRFRVNARTTGVVGLEDERGTAAGIRISGGRREQKLDGDAAEQELEYSFEVREPSRVVELVAELRASAGKVWFRGPMTLEQRPAP